MSSSPAASVEPSNRHLSLHGAGGSDPGRVRENNEDRFHCDSERGIFIVVDGVGGHAGGEIAAETALLQVRTRLERASGSAEERLREAITLANNEVYRLSRTNAEWTGMACVLTAALVEDHHVTIGHVGDSRLYKLRPGAIEKLTHDHSPVGEREDAGEIDEIEAMRHPRRNEVFRDVGSERHTPADRDFIEIVESPFEANDALLLCSDGLSDLVTSAEMLALSRRHAGNPAAVVHALITKANRAGGKDNVTAVYVEGPAFSASRTTPATGTRRRVVTHLLAVLIGLAAGAAAMAYVPDWLRTLLPGAPVTAVTPESRVPRLLVVQQAAAAEFATINDALAAAQPGDTVVVGPGEYHEQIRLRSGVTLTSEIPRRAVIRPPAGVVEPGAAVTADGARGARFHGFQILSEPSAMPIGVLVLDGEVEIQDTRISGAMLAGVEVWGGTLVTLRANEIADNAGVGVRVRGGAEPSLLHNAIVRNGRGKPVAPGVLLDPGAVPILVGNVIADNGAEGVAGVQPEQRAELLRNNVFVADARPNGRGAVGAAGGAGAARR
jgi:serine/threonine protein phosphatase PrpC